MKGRRGLAVWLAVAGLVLLAVVGVTTSTAAGGSIEIVHENPDYTTLAVGKDGAAYGMQLDRSTAVWAYRLYRSTDEGRTWTSRYDFPSGSRIRGMSVLSSGTLLLHLVWSDEYLYRSDDGGQSWTQVHHFPLNYGTLTSHTVTDDGTHAYVASYNSISGAGPFANWVWRSADDGRTWQAVRSTSQYRHAHAVQTDPHTGWTYVLWGDETIAAIERTRDHGQTWEVVCSGNPCLAVDIAFGPDGSAVFGLDAPFSPGKINRVDLATGQVTTVASMAGTSFSAFRHQGAYLIGSTKEPQGAYPAGDGNLHLYLSTDEGQTFTDAWQIPYGTASGYYELEVQHAFPSGDFVIQVTGRGTIVARLAGTSGGGAPVSQAAPVVSGEARVGVTLSVGTGTWSNAPTGFAYAWQRCDSGGASCVGVSGASSSSYTLTGSDLGARMRAVVTATNASGSGSATTAATAAVAAQPVPGNTALPTISGSAVQGQVLSVSNGSWSNSPTSFAYQWQRCNTAGASCAGISGAVSATYALASADVGSTVRAQVTASNAGGPASATSAQTAVVAAPATPTPVSTVAPVLTGTAQAGSTLSVSNGSWTNGPTGYAYRWQRCNAAGASCSPISGATGSSLLLGGGDVGSTVRAVVTASNGGGAGEATSAASAVVAAAPSSGSGGSTSGSGGGGGGSGPADLALTLSADHATAVAGDTVAYRIQVRLANAAVTSGVTKTLVTATIPAGLTVLSTRVNRGAGCTVQSSVTCDLDFLSGSLVAEVEISARVTTPGVTVVASVSAPQADPDTTNNAASLTVPAPLSPAALAPPVAVRAPRLVRVAPTGILRATRSGGTAIVATSLRVSAVTDLRMVVRAVKTGGTLGLRPGSRLGTTVAGRRAQALTTSVRGDGLVTIRALLDAARVRAGARYVLQVSAVGAGGRSTAVSVRFDG